MSKAHQHTDIDVVAHLSAAPSVEILRSLAGGVRGMAYGDPCEGPTVQASDVVLWAVDEIDRLRDTVRRFCEPMPASSTLTDGEREVIEACAELLKKTPSGAVLRDLLKRHPKRFVCERPAMTDEKTTAEPSGASGGSPAWIPVAERLPLERPAESWETLERTVIVWDGKDVYEATYYAGSDPQECGWGGCRWAGKDIKPTHWMPFPAPPTDAK